MRFDRVAVVGVGLIGGSFALALKQAKACGQVVGVGRTLGNLKLAQSRGAIDAIEQDLAVAVKGADLVLIAAPVAQAPRIFSELGKALDHGTLVTDAGSTKRDVIAAARTALGAKLPQFVPGHPIAGAEKSGAGAASPALFQGKRVVLTPLRENPAAMIEKAKTAWTACGARVSEMDADEHDAVLAAVSHLPHLLAFALVHEIAARADSGKLFGFAAGGFRDFTRIASSDPEMWRDICVANRDLLAAEVSRFGEKLKGVRELLDKGDAGALEKLFAQAREARERWLRGERE